MFKQILLSGLVITLSVIIGCSSGGGGNTIAPDEPAITADTSAGNQLWGLWQFSADLEAQTLDVVPLRTSEVHLNARVFLEPPPLVYLTIESLEFNGDIIEVDIGLRHPFVGLTEFTGFDVCGTLISNGSYGGYADSNIHHAGPGDTYLLNPDGHARWWNPDEFPHNPTTFAYNDGLLGAPDSFADYNSTINGYKYFCDDIANPDDPLTTVTQENRGMFSAGQKNVRHYSIQIGADGLIFNYAVDANWQFPQGDPPWTAPDDFGPEANRVEPWYIAVNEVANSLYYFNDTGGGGLELSIDVYDWFSSELNTLYVEAANGIISQVGPISPSGGGEGYSTYSVEIVSAAPVTAGNLDILITIETEEADFQNFIPGATTSAYLVYTTTVADQPPGEFTVTDIIPGYASPDSNLVDVDVIGTGFFNGPSLAVRLEKTGEPDIVATNVGYVDDTNITCDLYIPSTAALGLWDVHVINGTGVSATGVELFQVSDCGTFSPVTNSSRIYCEWYNSREGVACTRSGQSYTVCSYGPTNDPDDPGRLCAEPASAGSGLAYVDFISANLSCGYQKRDIVSNSQNLLYFAAENDYSILRQIQFTPGVGFGTDSDFGSITTGWQIHRITVDPYDNPVILAYNTSDSSVARIFHWNGTAWDETDVPNSVVIGNYGNIRDFDYNPVLLQYAFVCVVSGLTDLYAIDMDGDLQHADYDVFHYNHDLTWNPGIYIDQVDPTCHVAVWGGSSSFANPVARPIVLFDATYQVLSEGQGGTNNIRLAYGPRGAWAPGTNRLFAGGSALNVFTTRYFILPTEW
jgi:hypothetical protein